MNTDKNIKKGKKEAATGKCMGSQPAPITHLQPLSLFSVLSLEFLSSVSFVLPALFICGFHHAPVRA